MTAILIQTDEFLQAIVEMLNAAGVFPKTYPISYGVVDAVLHDEPTLVLVEYGIRRGARHFSGEDIARTLNRHGIPAILLCRAGGGSDTAVDLVGDDAITDDSAFELLRTEAVTGVVNLDIPVREIAFALEKHDARHRFPNCIARFYGLSKAPPNDMNREASVWRQMAELLGAFGIDVQATECALLFRRLVSPCASNVYLENKAGGKSGALIFRAKISFGDGPVVEDLAVKYGERKSIQSEAMHYDRFVGPLPDGVAAQLRWRAETERLGALAYSWVGDSVEDGVPIGPFSGKSNVVTWDRRRKVISRLFLNWLNAWYQIYRNKEVEASRRKTLREHYLDADGLWPSRPRFDELQIPFGVSHDLDVIRSANGLRFRLSEQTLTNPASWVESGGVGDRRVNRLAPCHGDLHVKNIYALPDDSPRLIDFGTTTLSHVYRDFAALEVSLRLTCIPDTDPRALMAAEDRICGARTLSDEIDFRGLGGSSDLKEAVRTTIEIRHAALEASGYHLTPAESMQEYLFAITAHLLRYATGRADEVGAVPEQDGRRFPRMWHAWYGAARAATRAVELSAQ